MRTSQGLLCIAAILACSGLGSLASASCPSSTPYGCVESYAPYVYPWPCGKTYCRRWMQGSFKLVGIHGAPTGFRNSQLTGSGTLVMAASAPARALATFVAALSAAASSHLRSMNPAP